METVKGNFKELTRTYEGVAYDDYLGKARLTSLGNGTIFTKSNTNTFRLVTIEFEVDGEVITTDASASPTVFDTLKVGDILAVSGRQTETGNYFSVIGVSGAGLVSNELFAKIVASATVTANASDIPTG